MTAAKQKLYIKTYGCQMNVYDSERMAELLSVHGYEQSDDVSNADMVILNTCHIREKASEKMYSELGRINAHKQRRRGKGDNTIITVAGCVAQAEGEEIFRRAPFVDVIVGPQSYQTLPDLLSQVRRDHGNARVINLELATDKFDTLPQEQQQQKGVTSFLSIQEGCDKFCTFCVVPYTRGAEYSRSVSEIYREAIKLVAGGTKEISLLGQNVNAYHGEASDGTTWDLGKLIKHLAKIEGLERIRYTTSHPRDMHESLYEMHANEDKLMPFLHLPVQSGSSHILERMNRKHSREYYFRVVERLREARPNLQLSSDFIVGFPGESDQDFEDTMDLVRRVKFSQCYSFKYSPRPGTPGAEYEDQVPEEVKDTRLRRLQALLSQQQAEFNQSCIDQTLPVLFEKVGRYENQYIGKSPYNQSVHVTSNNNIIGTIRAVKIDTTHTNSLGGVLVND